MIEIDNFFPFAKVIFRIMKFAPLASLGAMTLTSKDLRNLVVMYVHSKEGIQRITPIVKNIPESSDLESSEYKLESRRCHDHYKQLGIMLKRATCLFSTRDRLAEVGKILDQVYIIIHNITKCLFTFSFHFA